MSGRPKLNNTKAMQIWLRPELHKAVADIASEENTTVSEVVRRALAQHVAARRDGAPRLVMAGDGR